MAISQIIHQVIVLAFGLVFVIALLGFIYRRDAFRWRHLAEAYGGEWRRPLKTRWLGNVVLYGRGVAFVSYPGIVLLGVHEDGIALRVLPPFSFFNPPLFIPFSDIRAWKTFWYLKARSVELDFERAQGVQMVLPACDVRWISENANVSIDIADGSAPQSARPALWHALSLFGSLSVLSLFAPYALFENPWGRRVGEETLRAQFHLPDDVSISMTNSSGRQFPCAVASSYQATATFTPDQFARFNADLGDPAVWAPTPLPQFGSDRGAYLFEPEALEWRDAPAPSEVGGRPLYWPPASGAVAGRHFCYSLRKVAPEGAAPAASEAAYVAVACVDQGPAGSQSEMKETAFEERPVGATVRGGLDEEKRELTMFADFAGMPDYCRIRALDSLARRLPTGAPSD
ncbi:MAG: hypothetical protein AB7F91_07870 [Parvularculaceae bacterium]